MKNFLINFGAIALVLTILVLMFRKELKELLSKKKADEPEEENDENEIKENEFLYWFLNILGAGLVWLIIILLWIALPVNIEGFNLWLIAFCVWPVIAWKISARTLKANETGGAYGLGMLGGEIPLLNNLKPERVYYAFPGFVSLHLDSKANRVYEIKGISDVELEVELSKSGATFTEKNVEALINSWAKSGIYRFREITTATPKLAESHWESSFPFPTGLSVDKKGELRKSIESDVNHKQITLTPSMQIIVMIENYFLYRKNVEGETPEEKRIEVGKQLTNIARSMTNTEFKKMTYAQLIWTQTGTILDERLTTEIEGLVNGYGDENRGGLGLEVIDSRITALGAPETVHKEVNKVVKEGFTVQVKKLEGEGNKQKQMLEADAKNYEATQLGIGKARSLEMLFAKAKKFNVDPGTLAAIQAQVTAFEFGKHTYFSDGSNTMGMNNDQAFAKFAAIIADAINEKMGGTKS